MKNQRRSRKIKGGSTVWCKNSVTGDIREMESEDGKCFKDYNILVPRGDYMRHTESSQSRVDETAKEFNVNATGGRRRTRRRKNKKSKKSRKSKE